MNIDEFLKAPSAQRLTFHFTTLSAIRSGSKSRDCPITALCNALYHTDFGADDFDDAAVVLGIFEADAARLVLAADNFRLVGDELALRRRLLKACGL